MTVDEALGHAYRYLGGGERTVAEVRAHLERRGVEPVIAERAIAELIEQGYVDDRRFAGLFVQDKRALESWGEERIRRRLVARGVDADLARTAVQERAGLDEDGRSELDRATALLRSRFARPPADARQRERALGLLLRKGYDYELACDALRAHRQQA